MHIKPRTISDYLNTPIIKIAYPQVTYPHGQGHEKMSQSVDQPIFNTPFENITLLPRGRMNTFFWKNIELRLSEPTDIVSALNDFLNSIYSNNRQDIGILRCLP